MSVLSWGKPTIEFAKAGADRTPASEPFNKMPEIEKDTAHLIPEKGEKKEAKGEGDETIDVKYGAPKYTFEFNVFKKKGDSEPIETDDNGLIKDPYTIRLTPEDETIEGFIIDAASVSCLIEWTSAKGTMLKYSCEALKPKTGKIIKPYTKS